MKVPTKLCEHLGEKKPFKRKVVYSFTIENVNKPDRVTVLLSVVVLLVANEVSLKKKLRSALSMQDVEGQTANDFHLRASPFLCVHR